jgi:hypothetical protein
MARKKRPGRPIRHPGERLARSVTFRIRPRVDEKLRQIAAAEGRPLSEEIERRLDRSLHDDAMMRRFLGSDAASEILRLIRIAMTIAGGALGTDWIEDPHRAEQVRAATNVIVAAFAGLPVDLPPAESEDRRFGTRIAATLLSASSRRRSLPGWLVALAEPAPGQGDRESGQAGEEKKTEH